MFKLQKLNVVKVVETEKKRDKLISLGFKLVETFEDTPLEDGQSGDEEQFGGEEQPDGKGKPEGEKKPKGKANSSK